MAKTPSRPGRQRLCVRAIGFDFGDDDSEPDIKGAARSLPTKLSTLGTLSSSLLVFGSVLKGAVGEAFLATVAMANKYQATNKASMDVPHVCMDVPRVCLDHGCPHVGMHPCP